MPLITDPDNLTLADDVVINTGTRTIDLDEAGTTLDSDGVTLQCLYSFLKEEWKDQATLIPFDFPMVAITPEQFELVDDWTFLDDAARKLVRTGGWSEIDGNSVLDKQFLGVVTLGNFEDNTNDTAYYQFGTDQSVNDTVDFDYNGPVNEAIETYTNVGNVDTLTFAATNTITRATGSFITDGFKVGGQVTVVNATTSGNNGSYTLTDVAALTLTVTGTPFTNEADTAALIAVDNRSAVKLAVRVRDGDPNGKLYGSVDLTDIGVTQTTNKVERFPLSSATDLKISETDANIGSNSPYTQIELRYFDGVFAKDVDGTTNREFGVVVDVGTHSGIDGSFTAAGSLLTSNDGGIDLSAYDGGTLTIHEGADEGVVFPVTSTTATTVTVNTTTFNSTETDISFTLQRATPVSASTVEIYEKVQYQLRQTTNINANSSATQDVIGRTADDVLLFVGDTLNTLRVTNAANGDAQNGVLIEGFDSNDTNSLVFTDNAGNTYSYPFVAAGTISFNSNLVDDTGPAKYWMFYTYTARTNVTDFVLGTAGGGQITSAGGNLPDVTASDYVVISGLTGVDEPMNGVYQVTTENTVNEDWTVTRYDGETIVAVTSTTVDIDENAVDTPDAIIVDNNSGSDITGTIGSSSVSFDFDYDNNVQGGRTAPSVAEVTLIGIGTDTAQHVVSTGQITRATGLAFSLVAGLERNYENP